jgi:hypothetical protein
LVIEDASSRYEILYFDEQKRKAEGESGTLVVQLGETSFDLNRTRDLSHPLLPA